MRKFISLFLPIFLIGCISSSPVYKIDDLFQSDGSNSIQLIENHLPALIGADVAFNAEKFIARDGNVYYSIVLHVFSLNGLFIEEGESLVLLADGTRIGFSGEGSENYRDVWDEIDRVGETAFYDVTSEQLKNNRQREGRVYQDKRGTVFYQKEIYS